MSLKKESLRGRATFNLANVTTDRLEDAWMKLRGLLKGHNISKSSIVEVAINIILDDLKNNKENSKIYKALSKN